jgi:hypothetical protein
VAVNFTQLRLIDKLIDNGADTDAKDDNVPPFAIPIFGYGDRRGMRFLPPRTPSDRCLCTRILLPGHSPPTTNHRRAQDLAPIHYAARNNLPAAIERLVEMGTDLEIKGMVRKINTSGPPQPILALALTPAAPCPTIPCPAASAGAQSSPSPSALSASSTMDAPAPLLPHPFSSCVIPIPRATRPQPAACGGLRPRLPLNRLAPPQHQQARCRTRKKTA